MSSVAAIVIESFHPTPSLTKAVHIVARTGNMKKNKKP